MVNLSTVSAAGMALFGAALFKMGGDALRNPHKAASGYGLDVSIHEAERQVRVWGIREVAFGTSVLALLSAGEGGLLRDGRRSAGIVTVIGGCVGLGDALLVRYEDGNGALGHAVGGAVFGVIGAMAYMTS